MGAIPKQPASSRRAFGIDGAAWVFSLIVSVLVLIGWAFDIETFKRVRPRLVAMNPASAVTFILLGASLRLSRRGGGREGALRLGRFLAILVISAGVLKLGQIAFGWPGGIDQVLFAGKLAADPTGQPNRMAPNAALDFILLGCALFALDWRPWRGIYAPDVLIVISTLNSLLPLIGYLYGMKLLNGIGSYIPMAPHAALLFLALGVGILFARPGRGLTLTVVDEGISGVMVRRLLPAVIGLPILLGWLRLQGHRRNLYDPEMGMALLVVAHILLFTTLVWWNSFLLHGLDARRRQAEGRMRELTLTDDLTGLRNRRGFYLLAEQELKLALGGRTGIVLWCVYADLDGLKWINDTLGHDSGSRAIAEAAGVLRATFRDSDIIARLGGDEFAVLAMSNTLDGGGLMLDRLQDNVEAFNIRERPPYRLSLSVGLVRADPGTIKTVDELLERADRAMYDEKRRRKAESGAETSSIHR